VPFAYYSKLSKRDRAIYDRSDRIVRLEVPRVEGLRPIVGVLAEGLARDDRRVVEAACNRLVQGMTAALDIEPVKVMVLAVRPRLRSAELHGLYSRDGRETARIRVWMRTVAFRRVVAFRTFLRTLLHEMCHHVDYTLLRMPESFHTEGFFKRESSLFHQLVPPEERGATR
jgi:hypothetical protein